MANRKEMMLSQLLAQKKEEEQETQDIESDVLPKALVKPQNEPVQQRTKRKYATTRTITKPCTVTLKISQEQFDELQRLTTESGCASMSEYIRKVIFK